MELLMTLVLAFSIFTGDVNCGNFPPKGFDGPDMAKFTGTYSNFVYGYSVKVPRGLVGHNTPAPSPQHGYGIVLSWEPRAYIFVDGSYNSSEAKNANEIEETYLKFLQEESAEVIKVEKSRSVLGPLSARRYVAKHTCKKLRGTFIEDMTIALHKGVVYSAGLLTTPDRYLRDKPVLEQMLKTWRLAQRK